MFDKKQMDYIKALIRKDLTKQEGIYTYDEFLWRNDIIKSMEKIFMESE